MQPVPGDARRDGFIQNETDGHHLASAEGSVQGLFEVVHDDKAEDLVVADDLGQRPAALPALLPVLAGRRAVPAVVVRVRVGEAPPQLREEGGEVIEQDVMVNALGVRLLFDGPLSPALDEHGGIALDKRADFDVCFRPELLRLDVHAVCLPQGRSGASLHERRQTRANCTSMAEVVQYRGGGYCCLWLGRQHY